MRDHALRALVASLLAWQLWALAGDARAHGPAPVALEVLAHDGQSPTWLRTNIGLAHANADGSYDYVCPSRWDGNELARAVIGEGGLLVHSLGVAYLSTDDGCTFEAVTGDDAYVTGAAATDAGFLLTVEGYPLDLDPDHTRLVLLEGGGARELELSLPGAVDGVLATDMGVLLGGAGFVADLGGVRATFDVASTGGSHFTPRAVDGQAYWLQASGGGEVWLLRVEGDGVEASEHHEAILGPIQVGSTWVAVFDGVAQVRTEAGWSPRGEVAWTCLQGLAGRRFACSLEAMLELSEGASIPEGAPVFSMRQLGAPRSCGSDDADPACARDWAHFAGEAGWLDGEPAPPATSAPIVPGGCAVGGAGGGAALFWLALLFPWLRRRR